MFLHDQVWTGPYWTSLQWWPPDISSKGVGYPGPRPGEGELCPGPMSRGVGTHIPCSGGTLPHDLSNDAFGVTYHLLWTDTHLWKHYLPQTSLAGSISYFQWDLFHIYMQFWCQCCSLSRILDQNEVTDDRTHWPFSRQVDKAAVFEIFFFWCLKKSFKQTHCSRMHTVRCSSRLLGGVCLEGVCVSA